MTTFKGSVHNKLKALVTSLKDNEVATSTLAALVRGEWDADIKRVCLDVTVEECATLLMTLQNEKEYNAAITVIAKKVIAMVKEDVDLDMQEEDEEYDEEEQIQDYTEAYLAEAYKDIENRHNVLTF